MVEMIVDSVRVSMSNQHRVVMLKDTSEGRYLLVWIAQPEATAIAQGLQGETLQRPLTHDLLKSVITEMGGRVTQVTITEVRHSIFHAQITIEVNGRTIEVDSRTSDAIALAVRVKCPIYAADSVIEEAGVFLDEIDRPSETQPSGKSSSASSSSSQMTRKEMPSVFRDFINDLDILDDLGK
jgi:uncharacterized protein